jgi:ABC-2 type transport system permease protein
MEGKPRKEAAEKLRSSFKTRSFRVGSYSVFSSLIVVAIAVAVVLAAAALPVKYTQFDMTSEGLYSLSEQTVELCTSLTEEVTLNWIVQAGDEDNQLKALLDRYRELSQYVKVQKVDPVENPSFASAYTQNLQYNNSVIVVCGGRSKFVDYYDIFVPDYASYYTTGMYSVSFNGEGALTSAIDYVTSQDLSKLYILGGHGEQALPNAVTEAIAAQNILTENLSLLTSKTVPEDSACVLVCSPASDISADEKTVLQSYLEAGGHMLLITNYLKDGLPNLEALMADYGTALNRGVVLDSDSNYNVQGVSYYLLPKLESHEITNPLVDKYYVLMPMAQGLTVSDGLREGLTVTKLLTTSDAAFSKVNINETGETSTEYEEGDIKGPFALGAAVEEDDTRIVWFTTGLMLDDQYNTLVGGADRDLFINALNWMCEREERISIGVKNFDASTPITVPTADTLKIGLLVVVLIPLGILAFGITVVVRRRRR